MLFLPDSVRKAKLALLEDAMRGRITEEQAWRQALELNPDDYPYSLTWARSGGMRENWNPPGALLWRAIGAHPLPLWSSPPVRRFGTECRSHRSLLVRCGVGPKMSCRRRRKGPSRTRLPCSALLAGIAAGALTHVRDEYTTVQETRRRALQEPPAAVQERDRIPPQAERELLTKLTEKHFAAWPDTALPALDGRTPREAAKTEAGRRKVSLPLGDFENAQKRKRRVGERHSHVNRLRAELGAAE